MRAENRGTLIPCQAASVTRYVKRLGSAERGASQAIGDSRDARAFSIILALAQR
jgi:hypothetical protein